MEASEINAERLMQNMYRMARCRHALFREYLSRSGVTLHQFHLLLQIKVSGKAKVSDLSDLMLVSMPTASRMINALCDTGLVRKEKDSEDRRSTFLVLTPKGDRVVGRIHDRQMRILSEMMERIPEAELEVFLSVTERFADDWMNLLGREKNEREGADE